MDEFSLRALYLSEMSFVLKKICSLTEILSIKKLSVQGCTNATLLML